MIPRSSIMEISPYKGGASKTAGDDLRPRKLSSNENPYGPSRRAIAAFEAAAASLERYPDGAALALREAIAEAEELDVARIVCGAGSDELISLLCQAYASEGQRVLYSEHGFLMYRISALAAGGEPVAAPEQNLCADMDALAAAADHLTSLVFLTNPNNPTGSYVSGGQICDLRARLPEGALLVVDEAYAEYATASDYESALALVEERDDVVVLRTFSKVHGLAGLRVGWAYASAHVIDVLDRVRGPFNVGAAAQAAAAAAIADREYIEKCRALNRRERDRLRQALGGIGIETLPSEGNFILLRFSEEDAARADAFLQERGLILRRVESYGLPGYLRMTIGTEDDNTAVIDALSGFMHDSL